MVSTTGAVFLGLTVGCARCHDHKYEPITQRDYYRMFAIFNNANKSNDDDIMHLREPGVVLRKTFILLGGDAARHGEEVDPGVPAVLEEHKTGYSIGEVRPTAAAEAAAGAGSVDCQPRKSVDRSGDRQSIMDVSLRPRTGEHAEQLWSKRRCADASRFARLPGESVGARRLAFEAVAENDRDVGRVSAKFGVRSAESRHRWRRSSGTGAFRCAGWRPRRFATAFLWPAAS